MGDAARRKAFSFVAEISADELALRLMQIGIGMKAPPGTDATAVLNAAERAWPSDMVTNFPFRRMAVASIEYLRECVERGQQPS